MSPRLVLAVDGGNSKTDVALVTEHGELLGHARGPGSSLHKLGLDGCVQLLDELVRKAWAGAGRTGRGRADRAEVYLAGADLPAEITALHDEVAATGWAARSVAGNDGFALLRAGTGSTDAAAVVCGAGINGVGRAGDGRTTSFPSLGEITGDWGGGNQLGYEALWHAARGEDGRGQPTALQQAVAAHFGHATVAGVSEGLHVGGIPAERVGELTPVLFTVAARGDEVAWQVVARLATEIALLGQVALDRLGLLESEVPLVLGGGVVRACQELLVPLVRRRLATRAPGARVVVVDAPPVLGAVLYGLDALGASPQAVARARQEVRRLLP